MESLQKMVAEFHLKFGQPVETLPKIRNADLRIKLIKEEYEETVTAIKNDDLIEAVDGLCDLVYVCMGAALEFGVDLEPIYAEVHKTNMAKKLGHVRGDGKILKGPDWQPPKIAELLDEQRNNTKQ